MGFRKKQVGKEMGLRNQKKNDKVVKVSYSDIM
jgi:hypothetical protein